MKVERKGSSDKDFIVGILRIFNQVFVLGVIGLTALFFYRYMNQPPIPRVEVRERPHLSNTENEVSQISLTDQQGFYRYYNRISNRDIFESPWEKPQPPKPDLEPELEPVKPKIVLPELQTLVRIAGIVVDQENSQAIVEDLKGGETRFMHKGDIVHGARLVDIREDKVVFIYDEERVELKP